jgi:hypothetical protein
MNDNSPHPSGFTPWRPKLPVVAVRSRSPGDQQLLKAKAAEQVMIVAPIP